MENLWLAVSHCEILCIFNSVILKNQNAPALALLGNGHIWAHFSQPQKSSAPLLCSPVRHLQFPSIIPFPLCTVDRDAGDGKLTSCFPDLSWSGVRIVLARMKATLMIRLHNAQSHQRIQRLSKLIPGMAATDMCRLVALARYSSCWKAPWSLSVSLTGLGSLRIVDHPLPSRPAALCLSCIQTFITWLCSHILSIKCFFLLFH